MQVHRSPRTAILAAFSLALTSLRGAGAQTAESSSASEQTAKEVGQPTPAAVPEKLPIPAHYKEAFENFPPRIESELVRRVEAEFSDPSETTPVELARILSDAMLGGGVSREDAARSVLAYLRLGALPPQEASKAVAEVRRLFPDVTEKFSAAEISPGGISVNWFNSGNDPFGYGQLDARREELKDAHWLPANTERLPFELWLAAFPSAGEENIKEGDQLSLEGQVVVSCGEGDRALTVYSSPVSLTFPMGLSGFSSEKVLVDFEAPRVDGVPLKDLRLRLDYQVKTLRPSQTEGGPATAVGSSHDYSVFLGLKPVMVGESQVIGYTAEARDPQGQALPTPGIGEGFFRSSLYNMLVIRKETFRERAIKDRESTRARDQMLGSPLPEIALISSGIEESGFSKLPPINLKERIPADGFPGAITSKTELTELMKGKVVLIDFWTTWCGPCLQSIPKLNELARSEGLQVVGLIDGASPRNMQKIDVVVNDRGIRYPVGIVDQDTFKRFNGTGYPFYVLVDWRAGNEPKVVWTHLGLFDPEEVLRTVKNLPPVK